MFKSVQKHGRIISKEYFNLSIKRQSNLLNLYTLSSLSGRCSIIILPISDKLSGTDNNIDNRYE